MSRKNKQTGFKKKTKALNDRRQEFLNRRPHRSFRMTRRRDYKRSMKLPGYWGFTVYLLKILKNNWRVLVTITLIYSVIMLLLSSFMDQATYSSMRDIVDGSNEDGVMGAVFPTIMIAWGVVSAQLSGSSFGEAGSSQQVMAVLVGLFAWLATVWVLRTILAGGKPKARDGVYSSGGPVVALLILATVATIQLIPAAIAIFAYSAADASGLFSQTAILMLFGISAILLITLSLYWVTSTLIAMVIVTLPGMYPMQAIKLAGDLVIGRRIRILLRLFWMIFLLVIIWSILLIIAVPLDGAIKSAIPVLDVVPIVPVIALLLSAFSIVFSASYIYLLYRKVVDDDSAPA